MDVWTNKQSRAERGIEETWAIYSFSENKEEE
jgi:hypothetical protein